MIMREIEHVSGLTEKLMAEVSAAVVTERIHPETAEAILRTLVELRAAEGSLLGRLIDDCKDMRKRILELEERGWPTRNVDA